MADGSFPTLISKDTSANAVGNPIYIDGGTGATIANVTTVGTITNAVTVTATNLDIRDLAYTQDSILIYANTAKDGTGTDYVPIVDADGKLIISNPGGTEYVEDAAAAFPATGITTLVERDDALGGITPVEGDWSKLYCNANGALWVKHDGDITIADGGNSITVDGTVAATQSGTWNIGTLTSITNDVNIADGGNSITVDGTVAATQSGTWNIGTLTSITNDVNIADGGNSITVDGSVTVTATALDIRTITKATDSIQVSKNTAVNSEINPIFVQNVETAVSGTEVHDYATSTGTGNNDYTVTGTTFLLRSVIFGASGGMKAEIQAGPLASLVTYAVGFIPHQGGTEQLFFDPPIEVPVTSTGTVRVVMTNREGAAMDVYSTIIGNDIP